MRMNRDALWGDISWGGRNLSSLIRRPFDADTELCTLEMTSVKDVLNMESR